MVGLSFHFWPSSGRVDKAEESGEREEVGREREWWGCLFTSRHPVGEWIRKKRARRLGGRGNGGAVSLSQNFLKL